MPLPSLGGGVTAGVAARRRRATGGGQTTTTVVQQAPLSLGRRQRRARRRGPDRARHLQARRARRRLRPRAARRSRRSRRSTLRPRPAARTRRPARASCIDDKRRHPHQRPRGRRRRPTSRVQFADKQTRRRARWSARTPSTDLALLKVDPDGRRPHAARRSATPSAVQVGDPTIAIGNPFGLDRTLTTGVVSALQRPIHGAQRLRDRRRHPDRRGDQPRQLRRPAARRRRPVIGINSQIATGGSGSGQRRHRLRGPGRHRQADPPRAREAGRVEPRATSASTALTVDETLERLNLPVEPRRAGADGHARRPGRARPGIRAGDRSATLDGDADPCSAATSSPRSTARTIAHERRRSHAAVGEPQAGRQGRVELVRDGKASVDASTVTAAASARARGRAPTSAPQLRPLSGVVDAA